MKWSKTIQFIDNAALLLKLQLSGQITNPIRAYKGLLAAAPTVSPNQPLPTHQSPASPYIITSHTLSITLMVMLANNGAMCI